MERDYVLWSAYDSASKTSILSTNKSRSVAGEGERDRVAIATAGSAVGREYAALSIPDGTRAQQLSTQRAQTGRRGQNDLTLRASAGQSGYQYG